MLICFLVRGVFYVASFKYDPKFAAAVLAFFFFLLLSQIGFYLYIMKVKDLENFKDWTRFERRGEIGFSY